LTLPVGATSNMTSDSPLPSARPAPDREAKRAWAFLAWIAAIFIGVLGFLPVANWIPGGHEAEWYGIVASEWLSGSLIAVGLGAVLAILSRRLPIWRDGMTQPLVAAAHARPNLTGALLAACGLALYSVIARQVFEGRPLLIDELSQLFQARIFATGSLWRPAPEWPEFTSVLHILDDRGKWFSQFPPGGPLMLVPGVLARAAWLVNPVVGAVSVALFWGIARRIEDRRAVAFGASALFAVAPFVAFLSGSHMNHVTALMWVLTAIYALTRQTWDVTPRPGWAALCGFALGAAASIRPVDAVAFAVPAGVWMLARALRNRQCAVEVAAAGVALAAPLAGILWYNALTTGDPLLFAYEQLWGKDHGLGFHRAPWGFAHTPARGLELLSLYFLRLQSYLYETALPSLTAAVGALALARRIGAVDRYLLASGGALLLLYFAYWHDGFYLGPRFVLLLAPLLVLWTARFPAYVRERWPSVELHRGVWYSLGVASALAVAVNVPFRARQYAGGLASMRLDYTAPARAAGISNALILVRESWGTQLVARMWALGVPRSDAETLYRNVDACLLESTIGTLERTATRGESALARMTPLLADSARVIKSELSPDQTERMLPGTRYGPLCQARVLEDRAGFTLLAPLLVQEWEGNVYARDLHARDTLLLAAHPDRNVYLLRPVSLEIGAPLRLEPLRRDSLERVWRVTPAPALEGTTSPEPSATSRASPTTDSPIRIR